MTSRIKCMIKLLGIQKVDSLNWFQGPFVAKVFILGIKADVLTM